MYKLTLQAEIQASYEAHTEQRVAGDFVTNGAKSLLASTAYSSPSVMLMFKSALQHPYSMVILKIHHRCNKQMRPAGGHVGMQDIGFTGIVQSTSS